MDQNRNLKLNGVINNKPSDDLESGKALSIELDLNAFGKNPKTTKPVRVRTLLRRLAVMTAAAGALVSVSAIVCYFLGWQWLIAFVLVAMVAFVAVEYWHWCYVALRTAPRDICALYKFIRLLIQVKLWHRNDVTLGEVFRQNALKHPHKPCILFEDQQWDFAHLEAFSNQVANAFKSHGYKKGDTVALFMENRPEFIGIWLGLTKLGIIVPLINTNQRMDSLVHSIVIVKCQAIIFSNELSEAITEILDRIESKVASYQFNSNDKAQTDNRYSDLRSLLENASSEPPELSKPGHHDRLVYIYTSGTTGLPKAAVISNARYMFIAGAIHWMAGFRSDDCFYTPLPLYHTAGGCMSVGQMLIYGATLVIRKKFSASSFFPDCHKYNCTVAQYIGEMCRYILAVKPSESDRKHKLRLIYGNGLRPQIWPEFVERFNIKRVAEFYGATEGNANIVNVDNTVGAIGFVSRIIPSIYPISIIKVDPNTGEPERDSRGLCIVCKANEPGVFVGKIIPDNPSRAFLGYVDEEASKKKVVCDVFHKGDKAFLSGDILVADDLGNLFFKDRTGDTFRWKGENVSTSEIEAVLSKIISHKDVVVYGVEIKGHEGRAGMAAIHDPDTNIDLKELADKTKKSLPFYARPIFVRLLKHLEMTGTCKMIKGGLQKEGINVHEIQDAVYYLDNSGSYSILTPQIHAKITSGDIRL